MTRCAFCGSVAVVRDADDANTRAVCRDCIRRVGAVVTTPELLAPSQVAEMEAANPDVRRGFRMGAFGSLVPDWRWDPSWPGKGDHQTLRGRTNP